MFKKSLLIVITLLLLTILVGCSNSGKENADIEKDKPIKQTDTIKVAYIAMTMTSPQILAAKDEGVFERNLKDLGVNKVEYIQTRSLDKVWPMMDNKEVDFVYIPTNNFATYVTESYEYKSENLSFKGGSDNFRIIAGSLNNNFYTVLAKPEINSLADLDGKKVGIANNNYLEEMLLNTVLSKANLKTNTVGGTVQVEYPGVVADMIKGFKEGKYDALSTWTVLQAGIMKQVPGSKVLINTNPDDEFYSESTPQNWLIARKDLIDNNPELVKAFLKGHIEATELALAKKEELPLLSKKAYEYYFTDVLKAETFFYPESYYTWDWADAKPTYDPYVEFVQDVYDFLKEGQYLKNKNLDHMIDVKLLNEVLKDMGKPQIETNQSI